jgi:hypothetical protein
MPALGKMAVFAGHGPGENHGSTILPWTEHGNVVGMPKIVAPRFVEGLRKIRDFTVNHRKSVNLS